LIVSAPTFELGILFLVDLLVPFSHSGERVQIEVGNKVQQGEVCHLHPNTIFYDVLVGGNLVQGKYLVNNIMGTHIENYEPTWKLNQKV
jgi:hypothetical protein